MLGWILGGLVALADGMVWSELAAAFPGSGGTYHFYDAVYGESPGRPAAQVPVRLAVPLQRPARGGHRRDRHGPVSRLLLPRPGPDRPGTGERSSPACDGKVAWGQVAAMGVMVLVTVLAYRRIAAAGRLMVVLWVGMLVTVAWVIVDRPDPLRRRSGVRLPRAGLACRRPLVLRPGHGAGDRDVRLPRLLPGLLPRRRSRRSAPHASPLDPDLGAGDRPGLPDHECRHPGVLPWREVVQSNTWPAT